MPEPTSLTASATMVVTGATVPLITALGIPLGIRADLLIAGFFGCLVSIILFDAVPGHEDTWRNLLKTSFKRMTAAGASALTAGYLTPFLLSKLEPSEPTLLGVAFVAGVFAKATIKEAKERFMPKRSEVPAP